MRLLMNTYYAFLLSWVFICVESSIDPNEECIVHQEGEKFNATSVSIPPVSDSETVKLMIKYVGEDQGITHEFGRPTVEWSRFNPDWSLPGTTTSRTKIIDVIQGQAAGNCVSGDFTWIITGSKRDAHLYNTKQTQIFRITLLKEETEVTLFDGISKYYLCLNITSHKAVSVNKNIKCGLESDKELLALRTDYTILLEPGEEWQLPKITAVGRNSFSIKGINFQYKISFTPPTSVANEDILGHIKEQGNSRWKSGSPAAVSPGIATDVISENSKTHQDHCSNALLAANVGVIVLVVLVAILFFALIFTCIYFKKALQSKLTSDNSVVHAPGADNNPDVNEQMYLDPLPRPASVHLYEEINEELAQNQNIRA